MSQNMQQAQQIDTPTDNIGLSLVLPVYNERESIPVLHEKIMAVLQSAPYQWEAIYVDDGSTDGSTDVLHELQRNDPHIVVAVQRRNFGKSAALMTGFALAHGSRIITMDSDLQDEPAEIPRLLAKLDEGYDIVSGWKRRRQDPLSKRIPSKIANFVTGQTVGLKLHDMNSGLKAYSRVCASNVQIYGELHRYIPIIAHMAGFQVTEIPVEHHARQFGSSKYGLERLLRGGFDFMTILFLGRYGRRPLHFFGLMGVVCFVLGVAISLKLTIEWAQGIRPIGDRPLLLLGVLLILVGIQLSTIGLVAELVVSLKQRDEDALMTLRKIYRSANEVEHR